MFGDVGFWFFAVFCTVVFVAARLYGNARKDDTDARLTAFATAHGWSYRPSDPELATAWTGPPFTGRGTATTVMSGTVDGCAFTSFDYAWVDHSGDNDVTHHDILAAITLPATLPLLWISPQTIEQRLSNPLGAHDITFESGQFNDAFMVTADDDRYAYAVIGTLTMAYLLDSPAGRNPIRIEGNHALTWVDGPYDADRTAALVWSLAGFVNRVPHFVYEQYVTTSVSGYAGSVSGLRPEATGADLVRTAFVLLWGAIWLGISVPIALFTYGVRGQATGPLEWMWLFPSLFVVIGVLVVGSTLLKLVRGILAIRANQRQRQAAG